METQETERTEREALNRLIPVVDGVILSASRMPDAAIRAVAKREPLVLLNRMVSEVPSVVSDNVHAIKKASEHLTALGHSTISYLAGPEASWADGVRWRGLREAAHELDLHVHRLGPFLPTMRGGAAAAEQWLARPSTAVIAYNDLMAIGFIQAVTAAGRSVPHDVSVIGFDNIVDADAGRAAPDDHRRAAGQPGFGGRCPRRQADQERARPDGRTGGAPGEAGGPRLHRPAVERAQHGAFGPGWPRPSPRACRAQS